MNKSGSLFGPGFLRFVLATLVVINHSTPLRLGTFAVYVFFILSGYWIARMWDSKYSRTRQPYWTFIVSRWWRLAPVFFSCLLLAAISDTLLNQNVHGYVTSLSWWVRQLPIIGSASPGRILYPSWSIDIEMRFYVMAPLLIILSNHWNAAACWVLFACSTVFYIVVQQHGGSENMGYGWLYLSFFTAGVLLHRTGWVANRRLAWGALIFVFVIMALTLSYPPTRSLLWIIGSLNFNVSLQKNNLYAMIAALLMIPFVSWNVRQKSGGIDREIGNFSYPLYLFHCLPWEFPLPRVLSPAMRTVLWIPGRFRGVWCGFLETHPYKSEFFPSKSCFLHTTTRLRNAPCNVPILESSRFRK